MRLLLDTHALAWWFEDSARLSAKARTTIASSENHVMVSVVSAFVMTTKHRSGKWPEIAPLIEDLPRYLEDERFAILPLSLDHAELAGNFAIPHRDPFDRLLIAQAQIEDAYLVSNDAMFDIVGVRRLW